MRCLLFVLMLALLPLRGWLGDSMATQMAVAELQAVAAPDRTPHTASHAMNNIAVPASKPRATVGFDAENDLKALLAADSHCAGHADSANQPDDADDANSCQPCSTCGACHGASITAFGARPLPPLPMVALASSPSAAFWSADALLSQKPPIS